MKHFFFKKDVILRVIKRSYVVKSHFTLEKPRKNHRGRYLLNLTDCILLLEMNSNINKWNQKELLLIGRDIFNVESHIKKVTKS